MLKDIYFKEKKNLHCFDCFELCWVQLQGVQPIQNMIDMRSDHFISNLQIHYFREKNTTIIRFISQTDYE